MWSHARAARARRLLRPRRGVPSRVAAAARVAQRPGRGAAPVRRDSPGAQRARSRAPPRGAEPLAPRRTCVLRRSRARAHGRRRAPCSLAEAPCACATANLLCARHERLFKTEAARAASLSPAKRQRLRRERLVWHRPSRSRHRARNAPPSVADGAQGAASGGPAEPAVLLRRQHRGRAGCGVAAAALHSDATRHALTRPAARSGAPHLRAVHRPRALRLRELPLPLHRRAGWAFQAALWRELTCLRAPLAARRRARRVRRHGPRAALRG